MDDAIRCPICGTRERKKTGASGFLDTHWYCPDEDLHTSKQEDDFNFRQWVD